MMKYPWHLHYPEGMPYEVNTNGYDSLLDVFEECFSRYSSLPAFQNNGVTITFSELDRLSKHFAAFIQHSTSLKPGDRIALQMPNCLQYPVAFIGSLRAGLIVVNTNPLYTPREMEHQFVDSGAKGIVIMENFAHHLEKIVQKTSIKEVIVTQLGDLLGLTRGTLVNFVVKRVKRLVPLYKLPHVKTFKKVLSEGSKLNYQNISETSSGTVLLQYTGGTTGLSKGAQLSHRSLAVNILQSESIFKSVLTRGALALVPLPLYHITALHAMLVFMKLGLQSVLVTNPRDTSGLIKLLKSQPFQILIGVNTLFNSLLNHPSIRSVNFKCLKTSVGGGMAIQEIVSERWNQLTGRHITQGYGLSETSPMLTFNIPGKDRPGYIGIPLPSTEIRIMNNAGEEGELCARGPQVFKGYWNKNNEDVFYPDGWFKTGDVAILERDGFLKIVDRKKDVIFVSGFSVYPNEIEEVLATHPKVLEVAAIGVDDEHSTEVVKIFIVKRDEQLTREEVIDFCRENFVNYKRPKHIEFRNELPKSTVGKILRRKLRE
jgi:long-chain acyl-CoA synthetase